MTSTAASHLPRLTSFLAAGLFTLVVASATHAQVWNESGDAGDLVSTAQTTVGSGPLTTINGGLASPNDVDLYCIRMPSVPPTGQPLIRLGCVAHQGPNVWLFDAAGNGVLTNATCSAGFKTIAAPNVSLPAGVYYVAVSYSGVDPQSSGGAIWLPAVLGQRAPDGPGAGSPLTGWAGTANVQPINPYQITLTGMTYCDAATPAKQPTWGALKILYGR